MDETYFNDLYNNGLKGWGFEFRRSQIYRYEKYIDIIKRIKDEGDIDGVLEVGCGDGTFSRNYLSFLFKRIVGIDVSHKAIDIARKQNNTIDYRCDSLPYLKTVNQKFDLITVLEVLYYLPHDLQKKSLKNISTLCDKNGFVLFSVNIGENYFTINEFKKMLGEYYEIIIEDEICIKKYYELIETKLWKCLSLFQRETWDRYTDEKGLFYYKKNDKLKRMVIWILWNVFNNKFAYKSYNKIGDYLVKYILNKMPIFFIDKLGHIFYKSNISVYITLCKVK